MSLTAVEVDRRRDNEAPAGEAAAVVVFTGETHVKCLRWLRREFRHCFIVIRDRGHWIACDPLCHRISLAVLPPCQLAELASLFRQNGHRVIETTARIAPPALAPLRPVTCVEVVKRVLGLRAPWVFTPWQLYRHLSRQCEK